MRLAHSDSRLGAFYRRVCSRMDRARAATARNLMSMVFFMHTRGKAFVH